MHFTKELRQKIVEDFCKRHGGEYDAKEFLHEVQRRGPKHPAYDWFTWDDDTAAHRHRVWQARIFVRDLRVSFSVEQVHRGKVRVLQADAPSLISPGERRNDGGGYVKIDPKRPSSMALLCQEAAQALREWKRRYLGAVLYAGGSEAQLDRVLEKLEKQTGA